MLIEVDVISDKRGAILILSGETASLATDTEIDTAVKRVKSKLDAAAAGAKKAIRAEEAKDAYS